MQGVPDTVPEGAVVPPPLDSAWAESTRKKALLKLEKLDTDLKNYKGNSIKESIRSDGAIQSVPNFPLGQEKKQQNCFQKFLIMKSFFFFYLLKTLNCCSYSIVKNGPMLSLGKKEALLLFILLPPLPSLSRRGHDDLGDHYLDCGDLSNALKCYSRARDYCTSAKHVINMCLNVIKVRRDDRFCSRKQDLVVVLFFLGESSFLKWPV